MMGPLMEMAKSFVHPPDLAECSTMLVCWWQGWAMGRELRIGALRVESVGMWWEGGVDLAVALMTDLIPRSLSRNTLWFSSD